MRQKFLKSFVLVLLFNIILISGIYASTNIYIDDISARAGEEVNIKVNIEGNTGFVGSQIILYYDLTKLEYISSSNGDILDGKMAIISNNENTSTIKQVVVGTDINDNGNLMTLTFKIKDNVTDATIPLELKVQELKNDIGKEELVNVEHTVKSGNIIISSNNVVNSDENINNANIDNNNENKSSISSTSVNDKVQVTEDENGNLSVKIKDLTDNGNVEYISSDENIATVDENGNIITKGTGECTVTTMVNGQEIDKTVINILPEDKELKQSDRTFKVVLICIIVLMVISILIFIIVKKRRK